MNVELLVFNFSVAGVSGFVHGALGLGYGMIAMALLTLVMPYSSGAAIVSWALLLVSCQISWSIRKSIKWGLVIIPCLTMTVGKILGVILLMNLESNILRVALGVFLASYSAIQLAGKDKVCIRGTTAQGAWLCLLGGLFGGVFNVSGPAAAIYYQSVCRDDTKEYAACLNFTFVPAAIIGVIMHIFYGNYTVNVGYACIATAIGVLIFTAAGIAVLKKIDAKRMRKYTYIYIGIMGIMICLFG